MKWYKRDPHRVFEGTRELTWEERGVYGDLIDIYIARNGRLPDDDVFLRTAIGGNVRSIRRVKTALLAKHKIRIVSGNIVPNGAEVTLKEAETFSEVQTERAENRWKNNNPPHARAQGNANTSTPTGGGEVLHTSPPPPYPGESQADHSLATAPGGARASGPPKIQYPQANEHVLAYNQFRDNTPRPKPPEHQHTLQNLDQLLAQQASIRKRGPFT